MLLHNESTTENYLARKEFCKISKYMKDHHLIPMRAICQPKHMSTESITKTPVTVKNMVQNLELKLRA